MILIWGVPGDGPLDSVIEAAAELGLDVRVLNQHRTLEVQCEMSQADGRLRGQLVTPSFRVALEEITAVYLRPFDSAQLPCVRQANAQAAVARAHEVTDLLLTFCDVAPARVVNRPSAMAGNGSKLWQSLHVRQAGFSTPATLVTTDAEAARAFWREHAEVIYKSVSGTRSIVRRLGPEDDCRLDDVQWCPTQFQRYVPGTDYRVHVVGAETFACAVRSDADDYRYAHRKNGTTSIEPAELPEACLASCVRLCRLEGLEIAGVDLRQTPEGEWFCFEVNPSPGFTYYQRHTGHRIGHAVARLLAEDYPPAPLAEPPPAYGTS